MRTPVGKDYTDTTKFIDTVVEPAIKKLVDKANGFLKARGIQVGAKVEWMIEYVPQQGDNGKK